MTQATLSALSRGGRISQRGDTAPTEELRCAIPQVEDLALGRSCVSHGAQRCGKVGDIAGKWKLRDVGRDRATCARIEVSRLEELRVEEITRRAEIKALRLAGQEQQVGCAEPGPRHLSLGQPIRITSGETSGRLRSVAERASELGVLLVHDSKPGSTQQTNTKTDD